MSIEARVPHGALIERWQRERSEWHRYGIVETVSEFADWLLPIPMVLHCPACGTQHIDAPSEGWDNPPHRSHLCGCCGIVWRPADVPTVGVAAIDTRSDADTWPFDMRDEGDLLAGPPAFVYHAIRDSVLEEAAKVCEGVESWGLPPTKLEVAQSMQRFCAKAIRAQRSDSEERKRVCAHETTSTGKTGDGVEVETCLDCGRLVRMGSLSRRDEGDMLADAARHETRIRDGRENPLCGV